MAALAMNGLIALAAHAAPEIAPQRERRRIESDEQRLEARAIIARRLEISHLVKLSVALTVGTGQSVSAPQTTFAVRVDSMWCVSVGTPKDNLRRRGRLIGQAFGLLRSAR
jgi:hypothetical protein